VDTVGL